MSEPRVEALLSACRGYRGGPADEQLLRETNAFIQQAIADPLILAAVAAALPDLPPIPASWAAISLGSAVEQGASVERSAPAVVEALRVWLPLLPAWEDEDKDDEDEDEEDELPEPTPQQAERLGALPLLCQSIVAHLARAPALRAELSADEALLARLEQLEAYSHGALWVRELLLRASGPLIVLHPTSGKGFRMRYENVATCFHLFSLIQAALGTRLPDGREPDEEVAAVARGRAEGRLHDAAWWHYGDPYSPTADIGASIWGEANVRSIPAVDGVQVVLLWPPLLGSRGWDSGFFGPQLEAAPPDVVLEEELGAEEVEAWRVRLGLRGRGDAPTEPA